MSKIPMTKAGYESLKEKLKTLQRVERPKVVAQLTEARGHGDLSENADYESAKEKLSYVDSRISDIQYKLANADIIEIDKNNNDLKHIAFGAYVSIKDISTDKISTYQIVGEEESDVTNGKLSISSPLARELIGCIMGDIIELDTAKGKKEYEVVKISYDGIG